jgi:hypothetical protein
MTEEDSKIKRCQSCGVLVYDRDICGYCEGYVKYKEIMRKKDKDGQS